jgi:hypothetical protein
MTFSKTVAAIKRNTRLLGEIEEASDFRIAYKTKDGWKRLRLPADVVKGVQVGAGRVVSSRLDKLVPSAVERATDAAMKTLVEMLNA